MRYITCSFVLEKIKKKKFDITVAIPKNKEDNKLASILKKKNKIKKNFLEAKKRMF